MSSVDVKSGAGFMQRYTMSLDPASPRYSCQAISRMSTWMGDKCDGQGCQEWVRALKKGGLAISRMTTWMGDKCDGQGCREWVRALKKGGPAKIFMLNQKD